MCVSCDDDIGGGAGGGGGGGSLKRGWRKCVKRMTPSAFTNHRCFACCGLVCSNSTCADWHLVPAMCKDCVRGRAKHETHDYVGFSPRLLCTSCFDAHVNDLIGIVARKEENHMDDAGSDVFEEDVR